MLSKTIRLTLLCVAAACLSFAHSMRHAQAQGAVLYSQPHNQSGGLVQSSWWAPDQSNYDRYVWDNFTLGSPQAITEVQWRGGYDPAKFGSGGPVLDFTVAIYASIPGGSEPDHINGPLVAYQTGGNAGQTLAGTFGGTTMYDYHFALPASFQATAGTKYWVYILAFQHGMPDWGIALGTGGNGVYFRRIHEPGDFYQLLPGDAAFTLLGPPQPIGGLSATNNSPTVRGQVTTLTATVSAGNGVSYAWDLGDQTTGSGQVVSHTYPHAGWFTATVTATNSASGPFTAATVVTITEGEIPVSGLVATNNSPTLWGSVTTLTASVASGSSVVYMWNLGDGQVGSGRVITHPYPLGVYTAVVTASNSVNTLAASTVVMVTAPQHVYLPLTLKGVGSVRGATRQSH